MPILSSLRPSIPRMLLANMTSNPGVCRWVARKKHCVTVIPPSCPALHLFSLAKRVEYHDAVHGLQFHLIKADKEAEFWPRLLKDKAKVGTTSAPKCFGSWTAKWALRVPTSDSEQGQAGSHRPYKTLGPACPSLGAISVWPTHLTEDG